MPPSIWCKATDHIQEMVAFASRCEHNGFTYPLEDGLYFDTSKVKDYGRLALMDLEGMKEGARVSSKGGKRNPSDFVVWRRSPSNAQRLMEWHSPWGIGAPGWHLECSAMSFKYLGTRFDIHTGGIDHVRVHHTNEVAQSECALGVHPWVGTWVHNEFLDLGGVKLSKSAGDVLLVDTLVERGIEPLAFRYFTLQTHYRQQQAFTFEAVEAAGTALRRLIGHAVAARDAGGEVQDAAAVEELRRRFWTPLADDLGSPQALAVISEVAKDERLAPADKWAVLSDADRVLGFGLADASAPRVDEAGSDPRIDALVAEREAARAAKDFATADRVRDELAAEGIEIVDTPTGPTWRRA
jgi:cysteinyl-tRNA synthetase